MSVFLRGGGCPWTFARLLGSRRSGRALKLRVIVIGGGGGVRRRC
jgi:hypothetical protein